MNKHDAKCSLLIVQYIRHYCYFEHYIKMGIGRGGQKKPCPLLDFHTWYYESRCFSTALILWKHPNSHQQS